ncbi:C39 family peptidase [Alkalimonas sp. MEB108]|uniref:C39 family peptidase n=1 Tax=Alkalimonas cellulosilytica TaxID=3058395 RepID=A0ABU7J1G3_9GAMM|nr:C39 family peptidase [Alkalimonas sp. MEB108]MEE2000346.1 C39 family peptidase [Alkalimonas sp. MEB108]
MRLNTLLLLGVLGFSSAAFAACPDNTEFDHQLSFCADDDNLYGPFTKAMVDNCIAYGGGSACTTPEPYSVGSHTINVLRWAKPFATAIRGTNDCPIGSVRSPSYGGHCFESLSDAPNNVYGNFTADEVATCEYLNGGTACYTTRWSASFYNWVKSTSLPGSPAPLSNQFGAWLWYIDEAGLNKSHQQLANELAALGVKRVFIKIADNTASCSLFPDACSTQTTQIYKDKGIEPWAWAYNYPGNYAAQANALYLAAQYGYVGFITDVEVEFNHKTTELHQLFQAFHSARNQAVADGHANANFPLAATTWGNPSDHGMRVDIIDQYVDAHMPQTYLEVWGGAYMANAKYWIEEGNCEYRAMGATKPIWHIVSTEYGDITPSQLNTFMNVAGPNASVWRVPGGSIPQSVWQDWQQVNWHREQFDGNVRCSAGNNDMTAYLEGSTPPPAPPQPAQVPYWDQKLNQSQPYSACSVTSLAMVTDYFGLTDPNALGQRTPDYLYNRFGLLQTVPALVWGFNTIAQEQGNPLRNHGTTNGTIAQLQQLASAGIPTIVHGWFTSPGHILVVTGFDGSHYTVNDPFGVWNLQKWGSYDTSKSGKGVRYPKAAFEYAINDNGTGNDLWLHTFQ